MQPFLKKQRVLSILNLMSVLFAVGINYFSQIYTINGNTISDISEKYDNLFTPAGYAFAIWGVIFIALFIFALYQIYRTWIRKQTFDFIRRTGLWFVIANLFNGLWVAMWLAEFTLASVIMMFIILYALIKIVINNNMEIERVTPQTIIFGWWPISIYAGWISVAAIANISAFLTKVGWEGGFLSPEIWTIVMVIVATLLNVILIYSRGMREFGLVGAWALLAIYMRHQDNYDTIAISALIGTAIILGSIFLHAYKNRKINPFYGRFFRN